MAARIGEFILVSKEIVNDGRQLQRNKFFSRQIDLDEIYRWCHDNGGDWKCSKIMISAEVYKLDAEHVVESIKHIPVNGMFESSDTTELDKFISNYRREKDYDIIDD